MRTFVIAGAVLALTAAAPVGPAAAERLLTYGSFAPAPHLIHRAGLEPFFKRVTADSDGALAFELFVGGAMGGPKESLQTVRDYVVDSALIPDIYLKRELAASVAIGELGLLADDELVFAAAANETLLFHCPDCETERRRYGVKALAFYAIGAFHLMCREPVHTLADLQGVKVRSVSRMGVWMKSMGAVPVSVTTAEMYEALQRGQADCTVGSLAWLDSYNLKDLIASVIDTPMGTYANVLVYDLHEDVWAELSDDERGAIIKNLPKLVSDIVIAYVEDGRRALETLQAGGAIVKPADPAMLDMLAEQRKGEYAASAAKARQAGVDNPEPAMDVFLEKVEKWRGIIAEIGHDPAKYEQALWDEIFSKLE